MRFIGAALLLTALMVSCSFAAEPVKNPVNIDFSFAGYQGGGQPIPAVEAVISVRPSGGDDTDLLQSAIDHVASLPLNQKGFHGAVLLRSGTFHVRGQLRMQASGVVLRGSGSGPNGTVIVAEGVGRRTLIEVGNSVAPKLGAATEITDAAVSAGARKLHVASTAGLHVGGEIVIRRPSTAAWIKSSWDEWAAGNICRPARRLEAGLTRSDLGPDHHCDGCRQR